MEITDELVTKMAKLSKLEFEGQAREDIKTDLKKMIEFVGELDKLDTTGVKPLLHVTEETNVLRPDVIANEVPKADALRNGPATNSDYFKVPRVLKED